MARKIMILCGSPRKKGNTNTLAGWVADGATEAGAGVEIVDAAKLEYKANGCTACMSCQENDNFECVIDDEATDVMRRAREADAIVFATPVFLLGPTGQMKLLIDRMFCLLKINPDDGSVRRAKEDQTCALVATAGGDMSDGLDLVDQTFTRMAAFAGFELEKLLVPNAPMDPAETAGNTDLKNKALSLGRKLAQA